MPETISNPGITIAMPFFNNAAATRMELSSRMCCTPSGLPGIGVTAGDLTGDCKLALVL
jgi:hypothetical protein